MVEKAIEGLKKYISNYDMNVIEISLKYNHSFEVMHLMGELAYRLELDKEKIELARVIGLLHDIGRFEQFMKYGELNDKFSDHADESIEYLFDKGHIRDFIKEDKYDNVIKTAIKYHNKLEIPNDLDGDELLFTKMIRDMDKVDIFHQKSIHYNHKFKADEVTEKVLNEFKSEKIIDRKCVKSESDYIIATLAFIFDINFDESFDILVEADNFDLFLSVIEVDENSEKLWRKLRENCFDKINRGVEKVNE